MTEINDRLRILCLHGYYQNGPAFRSKLGSFRKMIGKYADLIFITAPHKAKPPPGTINEGDDYRGWWFNKDDGTFKGTNEDGPAIGFEESVQLVEETWKSQGPFHGILGFSQGACFVGLLCTLVEQGISIINPQFAVMVSGFKSLSLVHKNYYESKVNIPALFVIGESDAIITKEMSAALVMTFENAEILMHPGGHYLPATAQERQRFTHFFRERLQETLEAMELLRAVDVRTEEVEEESD